MTRTGPGSVPPAGVAAAFLVLVPGCQQRSDEPRPETETLQQELDSTRHYQTTRVAVEPWVGEQLAGELEAVSTIGDTNPDAWIMSRTHFDNCYWDEGRDWILENRQLAIEAALSYLGTDDAADRTEALESLGYAFHAAQDHYAHSNWVEVHAAGVLAPISVPGEPQPDGWYSGTYDNPGDTGPDSGPDNCPLGTPHHDLMNKDGPTCWNCDVAFIDASLATVGEIRGFVDALYEQAPGDAGNALLALGFRDDPPAGTSSRGDFVASAEPPGYEAGLWIPAVFCRPGTFINGFRQRVEGAQGSGDDTALNAVEFDCADADGNVVERLNPWNGVWGTWSATSSCAGGGFVTSAELGIEAFVLGDNTAANGARFGCTGGDAIFADNDAPWGEWGGSASCPDGTWACGAAVRFRPPVGGELDDLAMTGLRLECCDHESDTDTDMDTGTGTDADTDTDTGPDADSDTDPDTDAASGEDEEGPPEGSCGCSTAGRSRPAGLATLLGGLLESALGL